MTRSPRKAVFVIGAGASHEAGLPTGDKLKAGIHERLAIRYEDEERRGTRRLSDRQIYGALVELHRRRVFELEKLLDASERISDGILQSASIDNYLNSQAGEAEIEICAKLTIARLISEAEQSSRLALTRPRNRTPLLDISRITETWFQRLFFLINEDSGPDGVARRLESMTFVIFNYDRCVEHYLYHAIKQFFPTLTTQNVAEIVGSARFHHPYGSIGELPWRTQPQHQRQRFDFGGELGPPDTLIALAKEVRTFGETTAQDAAELNQVRAVIREADHLVFLGFAFHRLNMRLLFDEVPKDLRRGGIYASGWGLPDPAVIAIREELANCWSVQPPNVNLDSKSTSLKLLTDYERQLSMR